MTRGQSLCCAVALGLSLVGCAHGSAASTSAHAAEASQRAEVEELRNQLADRDRRLNQLESRLALVEAEQRQHRLQLESAPMAQAQGAGVRETVRIAPEVNEADDIVTTEGLAPVREPRKKKGETRVAESRPVLRLYEEGEPQLVAQAPSDAREAQPLMPIPQVNERLPRYVPQASGQAPVGAPEHYRQALDLVQRREFDAALVSLNDFLVRYGDDVRAPKVLYWRGEVLFAQRDYARALSAFETSIAKDPTGEKAPDAWLRIARCHKRLGSPERARQAVERLKTQFPNSDAARLAAQEDA